MKRLAMSLAAFCVVVALVVATSIVVSNTASAAPKARSSPIEVRDSSIVYAGTTQTITIPHRTFFELDAAAIKPWADYLSSDGAAIQLLGYEDEWRVIAVRQVYGYAGGAETWDAKGGTCPEWGSQPLTDFTAGPGRVVVACPGEGTGDHNLTISATGADFVYRLTY